jgi:His(2)-Cys(2) zinc finger./Integrase core domain.
VLINEPILKYPDYDKPFILTTDASNYAIGAVLSQGKIGSDLPVGYASRTLNSSEQHYSTTEKELLAIVWATKYFRPYLYGRRFTIVTDHKPLQWLFSVKDPNSKLVRYRLKLAEFEYDITYKKGTLNSNADGLSRIELHVGETHPREGFRVPCLGDELDVESMLANIDDNETTTNQTVHSSGEEPLIGIKITESPLNQGYNQIIFSSVNQTPKPVQVKSLFVHIKPKCSRQRLIVEISKNNIEKELMDFVKTHIVPKKPYYCLFEDDNLYIELSRVLQRFFKNSQVCLLKCTKMLEDIESPQKQQDIIKQHHHGLTNHRGINETVGQLSGIYFWPRLKQTIAEFINDCETCRVSKYERNPIKPPFNITPTPRRPFEILHVDTVTVENKRFLSIVDAFSKYSQMYYLEALQSPIVTDKLMTYFSHHGLPDLIISDNGTEFKNTIIQDLLKAFNIEIHLTSVNHPNSNSTVERFHSTLREHMRIINNTPTFKHLSTEQKVRHALLAYNHSIHSATRYKSIELINGHLGNRQTLNTNTEHPTTSDYVQEQRMLMQATYNTIHKHMSKRKEHTIQKLNKNRTEAPELNEPHIFVKTDRTRHKEKNRYKKDKVESQNKNRKTVKLGSGPKIHMTRIQRPRKLKKTSSSVTDVPCTSQLRQTQ